MNTLPTKIDVVIDPDFVVVAFCAAETKSSIDEALAVAVEPICLMYVLASN